MPLPPLRRLHPPSSPLFPSFLVLRIPLLLGLPLFFLHFVPIDSNSVFKDVSADAAEYGSQSRASILMAIAGFAADVAAEEGACKTGS